ncbi:bifunctional hydroxymethylpyrimidine kinase/phosphomethylpyrimidine kinase [Oscillospiraceae bacterium Marseille-Q3528]|nr:bifunctional hydroxymethylpyrimidine kinase/phosphomethylpyrimidine kinase [Oscillospiraceae bacterium Marseille-Q3528]
MAVNKNGIIVLGAVFVDIKGFPDDIYIADGRNAGHVEYIHGGVSRNVVEDIANLELRPTFLGIVDETALGQAVVDKLERHKVNTGYMRVVPGGMGTWLAVFDHNGDLSGSISQRPNLMPILSILEEQGDEIIQNCDSVVAEIDMDKDIIKKVVELCQKYGKKLYGVVSNMNIAVGRRDLLQKFDCLICNQLEAGIFFSDDYSEKTPEEMVDILAERLQVSNVPAMVVTMGGQGSVYAEADGEKGICPAKKVQVKDTTGAGDAFCAGVSAGLTYGRTLAQAVEIGTRLAASVITSSENVCPRFRPEEFGISL